MISSNNLIIKLLRLSAYTSALIAIVSIIPLLLTLETVALGFYISLFLLFFINVFVIWQINILLVFLFEKYSIRNHYPVLRYAASFILTVTFSGFFILYIESFNLIESYLQDDEIFRLREKSNWAPFFTSIFTNLFVLFMQELVLLREKKTSIELENAQLKIQRSEAINQQLKQHIHPHFLFNSLSILKSLIHKDPDTAEEYLIRLSDFLRNSISSNEANVVKLQEEMKICEDFIGMQKIRFGDALLVNFEIHEDTISGAYVPGFSLQLLMENAIKHNALTVNHPLRVNVTEEKGWIKVSNNVQKKQSIEHTTKSGLANLSQRYKIISGNDIEITGTEETFCVRIKILENENNNH